MRNEWVKGWALPLCAPLAFTGCMFSEPASGQEEAEEIIGGFPATSPTLDLVGALAFPIPDDFDTNSEEAPEELRERPYYDDSMKIREGASHFTFCTGTLIAPDKVLTAKHCVMDLFGDEEFVFGFDGTQPDRAVPITGVVVESTIEGGAIGLGSDVAVAFLAEEVDDVGVAQIGTLSDDDIDTDYVNIGYGVQNNNEDSGTRFLGAVTLRGIGGNMMDHLFGDFEGFLEHFPDFGLDGQVTPEELYEALVLLDEYEATFGHKEGNAQSCFGDSGGPVLRRADGGFEVYAVTSWGLGSLDLICDWGGAYAAFGPATEDFIEATLECGEVPIEGTCDGDVATRCAGPDEGGWKVVETDCSEAGLTCGLDENRQVACIEDACEDIPDEGMCDGDTVIRCTNEDEGKRRVVETDCSTLGMTCGADDNDELTCVDP